MFSCMYNVHQNEMDYVFSAYDQRVIKSRHKKVSNFIHCSKENAFSFRRNRIPEKKTVELSSLSLEH